MISICAPTTYIAIHSFIESFNEYKLLTTKGDISQALADSTVRNTSNKTDKYNKYNKPNAYAKDHSDNCCRKKKQSRKTLGNVEVLGKILTMILVGSSEQTTSGRRHAGVESRDSVDVRGEKMQVKGREITSAQRCKCAWYFEPVTSCFCFSFTLFQFILSKC